MNTAASVTVNGQEMVAHYGDPVAEYTALVQTAGLLNLNPRGRLVVTGNDAVRFLNGQVTNNVKDLPVGRGCYAALVNAKAKMVSDLNIYRLPEELLLDFEPGFTAAVTQRLDKYIIADDVRVVDTSSFYGLISVQGPHSEEVIRKLPFKIVPPTKPMDWTLIEDPIGKEIYIMNLARCGSLGYDCFIPLVIWDSFWEQFQATLYAVGGRPCGWQALEMARIEAGIPRFGADMDESNLAPETGIEERAISYTKGCYIGQEIIARIHSYGKVTKKLCGLRFTDPVEELPVKGDRLFKGNLDIGYLTSAVKSPRLRATIALGYVRHEHHHLGEELQARTATGTYAARITTLPFQTAV